MTDKKYANCNVAGDGKLYIEENKEALEFKIIDMSAVNINIETDAELKENVSVKLKIRLKVGAVDAYIDLNGKVAKPIENGYNIEFVDVPEETREEIDEMMRNSCEL